jgi:hypothetical protein
MSTLSGGPNIVVDGLVLALDAANTKSYISGSTTWNDLSRNNNNGTLINGPTFNTGSGGSIVFDGVDDYVDSTSQNVNIQGNTPFTVSIIYKTTSSGTSHLIGNWNVFVSPGWRLDIANGSLRILLLDSSGNSGYAKVTQINTYNNNTIYFITATYSGNSSSTGLSLFVNGTSVPTTTLLNSDPGTLINSKITLGASQINTNIFSNFLNGNIYTTQIYNRALSSQEVLQNYNATKTRFGL